MMFCYRFSHEKKEVFFGLVQASRLLSHHRRHISLTSYLHYLTRSSRSQPKSYRSINLQSVMIAIKSSGIRARVQHLCGDDLDLTIDSSSGSVPIGLCEGSMLRAALVFVSIALKAEPE